MMEFILKDRRCVALVALGAASSVVLAESHPKNGMIWTAGCRTDSPAASPGGAQPLAVNPVGPVPGGDGNAQYSANPFASNPVALQNGRRLFNSYNCSGCHGDHGGGGMGPSLRDPVWLFGNHDEQIFDSIGHGRSVGMPAWGTKVPPRQIWELVAYIKSLGTHQEPDAPEEPADESQTNPEPYSSSNPDTPIFIAGSDK